MIIQNHFYITHICYVRKQNANKYALVQSVKWAGKVDP